MRVPRAALLLLAVLLAGALPARADGGMPVTFMGARPLGQGESGLLPRVVVTGSDGLLRDGGSVPDPRGRNMEARIVPFIWAHGATPELTVMLVAPYADKELTLTEGGRRVTERVSGLGDLTVAGLYQLWRQDEGPNTRQVAALAGLTLPTGAAHLTDRKGRRLPPSMQLGTGSVNPFLGVAFIAETDRAGYHGQLTYQVNTPGAGGLDRGEIFAYDFKLGYRVAPAERGAGNELYLGLELNGRVQGRSRLRGAVVADSGGHTLSVAPSIQYVASPHLLLEAAYPIPVVRDLNGTQLAPGNSLILGIRYLF